MHTPNICLRKTNVNNVHDDRNIVFSVVDTEIEEMTLFIKIDTILCLILFLRSNSVKMLLLYLHFYFFLHLILITSRLSVTFTGICFVFFIVIILLKVVVGYSLKSKCPLLGPGTIGEMPSVEVLLWDPKPYLREFRRKPQKTTNG